MPPEAVPAYITANPIGRSIVLPDIKTPGKSIVYTLQEIKVEDVKDHPATGDPLKLVTLVLKN